MPVDGGTAIVNIVASGAGLSTSIGNALKGALTKATSTLTAGGNQLGATIGTALSAGATVGAVALAAMTVKGISDFQNLAGEVRVLEKQLGLTAEQASVFHAQATALGVATDKLSTGFGIFAKNIATAAPALDRYGIVAVRTATGQVDFAATLDEVRAKFQALPEGMNRTAFAMSLFGKSGKTLLPILGASNEEMAKFADNAEKAGLIMSQDDVDAARALSIAQRELGESFKGLEVSLARAVIPLLTGIADALSVVVRAIGPLLPLARDLGLVWLGYKAFTFIPVLLDGIAAGMAAVGASDASVAVGNLAVAIDAMGVELFPIAGLFIATAGAILSITGVIQNFADAVEGVVSDALKPFAGAAAIAQATGLSMADAFDVFNKAVAHSPDGVVDITNVIDNLRVHMDKAGNSVRNFAGLTNKHLKEFKTGVVESVQVSIGQFKNLSDAFGLTTRQLQNQANAAVRIARQEHKDLKEIFGDKSLTDSQKQALANLPADMRDAWAKGGDAAKREITKKAVELERLNNQNFNQITTNAKNTLKTGFTAAGKGATDGLVAGMQSGTGAAVAAANTLGNNVIQALRDSMGVKSPSKHTIKIGHELMEGLIQGMNERFNKVAKSLDALIPLIQKTIGVGAADQARAFGKELDALDKKFGRLKDRISGFHTGIRGAFSDFADLMGGIGAQLEQFRQDQAAFLAQGPEGTLVAPTAPNIGATIASQVGQAQLLAQLLKQLQQGGLSTANLAQLAGQGAGAIPIAQALLGDPALIQQLNEAQQQIADITQTTADKLTAAAFGDKVERMGNQLDKLLEDLNAFQEGLHVPELTDATRDFINQLRRLNDALASLGIGGGGGGGNTGAAVRDSLLTLKRRNVTTGL